MDHPWRGNVRELENVIERAVVLAREPLIGADLLPEPIHRQAVRAPVVQGLMNDGAFSFYQTMENFERDIIAESLKRTNGVQRRAAALLGLKATTLNEKIKRLKIDLVDTPATNTRRDAQEVLDGLGLNVELPRISNIALRRVRVGGLGSRQKSGGFLD